MKRCHQENLNTAAWWDKFHFGIRDAECPALPDVAFLMPYLTGQDNILDIGCGRGKYFPYYRAKEIHAIDISPDAIANIKAQYPDSFPQVFDLVSGPLPYEDSKFDVVYCGEVIEHIEKPQELITEIHRVLAPGGLCILNTPFENGIPADAHLWFFDREDILKLFSAFENVVVHRFDNSVSHNLWEHFFVTANKRK